MKRMAEIVKKEGAPWVLFLAFVFFSMVSMPMARMALLASLVTMLSCKEGRRQLKITSPTAGWLAYLALAVVVSSVAAVALDDPLLVPRKGLGKLTKLLWFAAIPVCAAQVNSAERFRKVLAALAIGGAVMAVFVLFGHTSFAWLQVHYPAPGGEAGAPALAEAIRRAAVTLRLDGAIRRALADEVWAPWGGRPPCFLYALTFNATLHNAQRLMVALLAATALAFCPSKPQASRASSLVIPVLTAAALVVTCKRGPLAAGIISLGLMLALLSRPWKALVAVVAICLLAVAVPQSRARLQMLPQEFSARSSNGRALMWTYIAPRLHHEHPWGIGFRSLTPEKMQSIKRRVEPNRTHFHCSPLQAFIDFGWLGLAVWFAWMALSFRAAARTACGIGTVPSALPRPMRILPLAAFAALFIVSLVEYNIADAAVVLLYGTILGLSETTA